MQETFDETDILAQTYIEAKRRFAGIDDLAHGWEHINRVYELALTIAVQEEAHPFVVGMAALLHDLGRTTPHDDNDKHHADASVDIARELMQRYHVPAETQDAILHAIVAHSFSRGVEPRTIEARVVRDADRVDGLGAIGIIRWAMSGANKHTPHTYHPADPLGEQHELDDHTYMLDHFPLKLLKLADTMTTETGRQLAQQRTAFMRAYLSELRREL
ncbi:MAG TPA: HD domain-containing protein [Ktedonobacteraceae bacterium]|nr:HD domain-containing protein [Ktedonobacteraceae bacterium]